MFKDNGELFYPAFPGDPFYEDFITGEGATLPPAIFPGGGPTGLAEFFGDHMVVNGKIWPMMDVEPRNYRLRLLNGSQARVYELSASNGAMAKIALNGTQYITTLPNFSRSVPAGIT